MALYRRAGIYYVKLTSPDGSIIRRSLKTTDARKAREAHDRLKVQLWDLHYLQKKPKRTWDEAALRWLEEKSHKRSYKDDVNRIRWFTQFLRGKTLDQITRDMIELAGHILQSKAAHFDPDKFKDEYENALKALVKRKAAGKTIEVPEREEQPGNVISLMDALKQSLKGRGRKAPAKSHARRATGRHRSARKTHRSTTRHRKAG